MKFDIEGISWRGLSHLGISNLLPIEEQVRYSIYNRVVLISLITYFLFIPVAALVGSLFYFLSILAGITLICICLYLNSKVYYKVSMALFVFSLIVTISFMSVIMGKESGVYLSLIPVSVLSLLFIKRKLLATIPLFACVLIFFWLNSLWQNYPAIPLVSWKENILLYSVMVGVIVIGFIYNDFFHKSYEESNARLIFLNKEITSRNRSILENVKLSREIQSNLLPPNHSFKRTFPESFVLYKPRDVVSGDFYWVEERAGKKYCAVIDCTGHGVPGAFMSILGHQALNRCINNFGLIRPADILNKLHEMLYVALRKEENNILDGMDLSLICVDIQNRKIEFCGSHCDLLLIRDQNLGLEGHQRDIKGLDRDLFRIKGQQQSVGSNQLSDEFVQFEFELKDNDSFYLYTDGYVDQFGGPSYRKLMHIPLRKMILEIQGLSMDRQCSALDEYFEHWKGSNKQIDDVCIIGINV